MAAKSPVSHYVDGRDAWKVGLIGFFSRFRGYFVTLIFTIITMGAPWWWPDIFPKEFKISASHLLMIIFAVAGLSIFLIFRYIRHHSQKSLSLKSKQHGIAHALRDIQTTAFLHANHAEEHSRLDFEAERLTVLANDICTFVRDYFRELVDDDTIGAAIRVAVSPPDGGEVSYATIGRSGLHENRASTSTAISSNVGIPRFFIENKNSKGVLVYHDIKLAAENGTFELTRNETLYPTDIATLMVAPLNGWDGSGTSMIGLLYITSRKESSFAYKYTDSMRCITDLVALTLSIVLDRLASTKRMPTINC